MSRRFIALISLILALSMIAGAFAACGSKKAPSQNNETPSSEETAEKKPDGNTTENDSGKETLSEDSSSNQEGTDTEGGNTVNKNESYVESELIEYANSIKNTVNYYYPDYKRESAIIENLEMTLEYGLINEGNKQVTSLKNKSGGVYVENTMDAFVRMSDGKTYYTSTSNTTTTSNLYRFGYYFYEARYEGQDFYNSATVIKTQAVDLQKGTSAAHDVSFIEGDEGAISLKLSNTDSGTFDPYIILADGAHSSRKDKPYSLMEVTMKVDSKVHSAQLYLNTGSGYNAEQQYKIPVISDGKYHTYTIPLLSIKSYVGQIQGIRFDFNGNEGTTCAVKEVNLVIADMSCFPGGLSTARIFNTYADKLHHTVQFSAMLENTNIAAVGMLTEISSQTVEKLILKDKNGIKDTLNGADWASVEYIGFDIKGAGIFGYILPADNNSGSLHVELKDGVYIIEQTVTPENGTIKPSEKETNNANDIFMGQRIYTDTNHDFKEFLIEAEAERNPIDSKYIKITPDSSNRTEYLGYDALRGIYVFSYKNSAISNNDYPTVKFNLRSEVDRKIYIMAYSDSSTVVETAFMLDENDMLIPVPAQVGKNFSEESGERNLYNIDDPVYSEAIYPLILHKGDKLKYSLVNIYSKWGNYPIKQISWIQFWAPYYHLSTATTETNCITPYYAARKSRNLSMLPDFRAMSAPPFSGVQRNSGGHHYFLTYTDADGNYITTENTKNTIGAYAPTYADVTMDYLSDDGKIKISYNHMEMPQEDENRTYYEISYEILDDISFKDFSKDFSFYSVTSIDPIGVYTLVSYLDTDNVSQVVDAKMAGEEAVYYTLGNNAPYFTYMKMSEDRANKTGYVNLAYIVSSAEFVIGGKKAEPNFVLADLGGMLSLSLNYKDVTLKKGDSIKINCILMPWGSQETIYDGSNGKAPDQNVLDVRENSIFNPLRAEAVKDCEVIDTVYLPMLKTTNGQTAEFTVKGGHDNCAVRIFGFDKLTVPKIYELIDGEWVYLKLSSAYYTNNPDAARKYDGYGVYYDGDGKFSYSFIAEMDNGAPRTFKIDASTDFSGNWSGIDSSEIISNAVRNEYINLIVRGENLFNASVGATGFASIEYLSAEEAVRYYADPEKNSAYFIPFQTNTIVTGDYFVIKYRISSGPNTFKFHTSTFENGATYDNHHWSSGTLIRDGQWHVLAIDLSKCEEAKKIKFEAQDPPREYYNTFAPAEDGSFSASFIRIDLFNQLLPEGTFIDLQYIGFSDDIVKIKEYNKDLYEIQLSESTSASESILTGGIATPPSGGDPVTPPSQETDPSTPSVPEKEPLGNEMNLVISQKDLYDVAQSSDGAAAGFSSIEYMDGYTRFTNKSGSDAGFNVFKDNTSETGKYLVLKYRLPAANPSKVATFRFHISTVKNGAAESNGFFSSATLITDDNWHLLVINMEKYEEQRAQTNEFIKNSDGKYYAKYLRLYIFSDTKYLDGTSIDIEYIAMCNSLGTVMNCNKDMAKLHLSETNGAPYYTNISNNYRYLDPTSGYTIGNNYYIFHVDNFNGAKNSYNSVSVKGNSDLSYNGSTIALSNGAQGITLTGWSLLQGGTEKYMWSVDGKTWHDATFSANTASQTILNAGSGQTGGKYTFTSDDAVNGGGLKMEIDLSAYAGQTVDVRIAAIPCGSEPNTFCVLTAIIGITVTEN